jgi:hypothetical protein
MTTHESQPRGVYAMVQLDSGPGEGLSVTLICNGKRFIVSFLPTESLEGTIEGPVIARYETAELDGDEDGMVAAQEEIGDLIVNVGKPMFDRLAPIISKCSDLNLYSLIYPETIFTRFATINGQA